MDSLLANVVGSGQKINFPLRIWGTLGNKHDVCYYSFGARSVLWELNYVEVEDIYLHIHRSIRK